MEDKISKKEISNSNLGDSKKFNDYQLLLSRLKEIKERITILENNFSSK
tara:strand:- start:530 stop:676 length:147 start_codon:yes stop_codon:yes gene_type:complete